MSLHWIEISLFHQAESWSALFSGSHSQLVGAAQGCRTLRRGWSFLDSREVNQESYFSSFLISSHTSLLEVTFSINSGYQRVAWKPLCVPKTLAGGLWGWTHIHSNRKRPCVSHSSQVCGIFQRLHDVMTLSLWWWAESVLCSPIV